MSNRRNREIVLLNPPRGFGESSTMKHKKHGKHRRNDGGRAMSVAKAAGAALLGTAVTVGAEIGLGYTGLSPMMRDMALGAVGLVVGGLVIATVGMKSPFAHDAGVAILAVPVGTAIFSQVVRGGINAKLSAMAAETAAVLAANHPSGLPVSRDAYFGTAGLPFRASGEPVSRDAFNASAGAARAVAY